LLDVERGGELLVVKPLNCWGSSGGSRRNSSINNHIHCIRWIQKWDYSRLQENWWL